MGPLPTGSGHPRIRGHDTASRYAPRGGEHNDLLVRLPRAVAALPPTPVPGLVSPPPSSEAQPTVLRRAYRQRRSEGGSRASRRGGWLAGSSARPRVRDVMRPDMVRSPWITPPLPGWSAVKPRSTRSRAEVRPSPTGRTRVSTHRAPRDACRAPTGSAVGRLTRRRREGRGTICGMSKNTATTGMNVERLGDPALHRRLALTMNFGSPVIPNLAPRRFLTTCQPPMWPPASSRSTCQSR